MKIPCTYPASLSKCITERMICNYLWVCKFGTFTIFLSLQTKTNEKQSVFLLPFGWKDSRLMQFFVSVTFWIFLFRFTLLKILFLTSSWNFFKNISHLWSVCLCFPPLKTKKGGDVSNCLQTFPPEDFQSQDPSQCYQTIRIRLQNRK